MSAKRKAPGVVALGIDGLDPRICQAMMEAGELPALSKLAERGGFSTMATSAPPQSPVAWSSMATSTNPGEHGLFDFLDRNTENYLIELGILKLNPRNILGTGSSMFLPVRKGQGFWESVAEAGMPATVLRWPITFPPKAQRSDVLSGLGVPDLLGGLGRYSFYSDSEELLGSGNKGTLKLVKFSDGRARTDVTGPKVSGLRGGSSATASLEIDIDRDKKSVTLTLDGDSDTVRVGEMSKWFRPKFSVGLISTARGLCKFYLGGIDPLRLHLTPVEVDPKEPIYPISSPEDYSKRLADKWGLFHTLGMPEDTNAVVENHLDEHGFLKQCDEIISQQEEMFFGELDSFSEGLLANVFFSSDRIQHIFWITRDPDHPGYNAAYAKEFGHVIPDLYKRIDKIVDRTFAKTEKSGSELIVCSDHGFCSFRYGFHVNSWLARSGLMSLKSEPPPGDTEGGPLFTNVDWSGTKAYFLGFNQVFLNLKGRESQGVVSPEEAPGLLQDIRKKLLELRDDAGTPVFSAVFLGKDVYRGSMMKDAPDLVLGFHPGFRASWQSAVGGAPGGPFWEPNLKKWSGDHLVDPAAVSASLFTSFPVHKDAPTILDVAPTALSLLGLELPENFEGEPLA